MPITPIVLRVYCKWYWKKFEARRRGHIFCCDRCRLEHWREKRGIEVEPRKSSQLRLRKYQRKRCENCNRWFKSFRSDKRYCSDSCRVLACRQRASLTEAAQQAQQTIKSEVPTGAPSEDLRATRQIG